MQSTESKFEIRPADRSDMELVADFVRSSAEWYRPILDERDMAEHDVDEEWAELNFERRDFYVGYASGEPLGTVSLQYFGDYAYLGYIYLDVAHVGKGYGQRLMRFAERKAREKSMKGMVLIAHPEATWAKNAYLKYGFEIIETAKEGVLAWKEGVLKPYYEEGFELYRYSF
ncbi:MAG: GNAT family N-acetyltransferase, partial [Phycisphaerales bacterium]|nr:GNAT family N-acetyltransferase [Phycisphaerales bacterium]